MKRLFLIALAAAAGCAGMRDERDAQISAEVEKSARDIETTTRDLRTRTAIRNIEEALAAYVAAERKIPESLDKLIPKYIGEIPVIEMNVRGHRDTREVRLYKPTILRDGQIDGTRIADSGRWGYVFNDSQVVVFVDCTHQSARGRPWYLERGN